MERAAEQQIDSGEESASHLFSGLEGKPETLVEASPKWGNCPMDGCETNMWHAGGGPIPKPAAEITGVDLWPACNLWNFDAESSQIQRILEKFEMDASTKLRAFSIFKGRL
ncbi:uncharacterized protein VTP21DRAFT_9950 [Calcarisporiella thermophila]|uniref:uncharacterized protein n=1 Tax=Calcarisporiella thermophila TaxID=911321 RepID=UPI0037430A2F